MKIIVECWPEKWGLPSIDLNALIVMSYLSFAGVPYERRIPRWKLAFGKEPTFYVDDKEFSSVDELFSHLRKMGVSLEYDVTIVQSADILAFRSYIESVLKPALMESLLYDSKNYVDTVRPALGSMIGFPFSLFVPNALRDRVNSMTFANYNLEYVTESQAAQDIRDHGAECLTQLSHRLSTQKFFLGDKPCSVDAFLFAHLALLLKCPLPSSPLQSHLQGCDNLIHFVNRVLREHFPNFYDEEEEKVKQEKETKRKKESDVVEWPNKRKNQVFAVLFGISAMLFYAFSSGMVTYEGKGAHIAFHSRGNRRRK